MDLSDTNPHFASFKRAAARHVFQGKVGRKIKPWASKITNDKDILCKLPSSQISRGRLAELCESSDVPIESCFLAIMAWGGQRMDHARLAWDQRKDWTADLSHLRHKANLSRSEAYQVVKKLRTRGSLPGLRPGYFTKLVFFLCPKHDGYVMDQWIAKSVNLICGEALIKLDGDFVSDDNSPQVYEQFCQIIDTIGIALGFGGPEVEERLFSKGGTKPGEWRRYVKANWKLVFKQ